MVQTCDQISSWATLHNSPENMITESIRHRPVPPVAKRKFLAFLIVTATAGSAFSEASSIQPVAGSNFSRQ